MIELDTCSHTISRPSTSNAMPLALNVGYITSSMPVDAVHLKRLSPGMSLKYSACSATLQTGPSLNT